MFEHQFAEKREAGQGFDLAGCLGVGGWEFDDTRKAGGGGVPHSCDYTLQHDKQKSQTE